MQGRRNKADAPRFDEAGAEQLIQPEREQRGFHPRDLNACLDASAPGQFQRWAASLEIERRCLICEKFG